MKNLDIKISLFSSLILEKLPITNEEAMLARKLPKKRSREFVDSRGKLRFFLSGILKTPPLKINLNAPPGEPPTLEKGLGYISISHCKDALLLGWSNLPIGVDIEPLERKFYADKIIKRFYSEKEKNFLKNFSGEVLRKKCLDLWVVKECSIKSVFGSVFYDLDKWEYYSENKTSYNKNLGIKKKIYLKTFKKFRIAIAYDLKIKNKEIFIYSN